MLFSKSLFVISCFLMLAVGDDVPIIGAPSNLKGDDLKEAENTLQNSLTKLASGDGPYYSIDKIHSATRQVVSGSLYKFKVDLVDQNKKVTKNCNVDIWSQPWLENGIEVTFNCDGDSKVVKKHSA